VTGARKGAAALKAAPGAQLDFWNFYPVTIPYGVRSFLSVYQCYKKFDARVGLTIIQHIGNFTLREIYPALLTVSDCIFPFTIFPILLPTSLLPNDAHLRSQRRTVNRVETVATNKTYHF